MLVLRWVELAAFWHSGEDYVPAKQEAVAEVEAEAWFHSEVL